MQEILTMLEIKQLYASEWVLIEELETDEKMLLKAGKVTFHSNNKAEVYTKAKELKPKYFAVMYMGKLPEDMLFLL
ncbi:MAG: hypothetical protein WAQ98_21260 [Blastocatellia bacterium]